MRPGFCGRKQGEEDHGESGLGSPSEVPFVNTLKASLMGTIRNSGEKTKNTLLLLLSNQNGTQCMAVCYNKKGAILSVTLR